MSFVATHLSVVGAGFVAAGQTWPANLIWSVSNPLLAWHNYRAGDVHQARMFCVFGALALIGLIREVIS